MIFSLVLVLVPVYSGSKSYVYIKIDTSGFRSQEFSSSLQSYHAVSGPSKHIKYWQVSDTAYQIISGMFLFIKLIFLAEKFYSGHRAQVWLFWKTSARIIQPSLSIRLIGWGILEIPGHLLSERL